MRQNPSMGWWYGRTHRIVLLPSSLTSILYSWLWCLKRKSNCTSLKPCMWRQRDLGVGIFVSYSLGQSDISIRSDKEGQSIYGPSLAPMEETVDVSGIFGGMETVQVTALGRSKAAHEFLMLHYFGLDSVKHWDALLFDVLPAVQFSGTSVRRTTALEMFGASHIAPFHCRMSHVLWTDSMNLVWNLLMGGRIGRYTDSSDTLKPLPWHLGVSLVFGTVEVPTCDTGFLHQKWPRFGGRQSWYFLKMHLVIDHGDAKTYQLSGSHSVEAVEKKISSICMQKQ